MKYQLEVCAFNVQSCLIAEKTGAVRVELCDNPLEGGTTPSYGAIDYARKNLSIDLYPIIRPRAGNYFYDDHEFAIMKKDIRICKDLGCNGISVGIQKQDGSIDVNRFKKLVEWAYPMGVTCNRVFDAAPNPFKSLETVIDCGCERILTSGLKSSAPEGTELLAKLIQEAEDRIVIMPGAGVRSNNLSKLVRETGAFEYHTSARKIISDQMEFQNPDILDIGNQFVADEVELRKIVELFSIFEKQEDRIIKN
ncbi:MAG TPA: copper homeostasis protein CutC [Flavitalea sp.]|nr:copper homeostasis protein CutC [Flavitalea sp.]